jgi:hypothetical protein
MRLKVVELVGPHCATYAEGEVVFRKLLPLLQAGETVELDLEDTQTTSSSFFNAAIGELYRHFSPKDLMAHLKIINLSPRNQFILTRTLRAAKQEYA